MRNNSLTRRTFIGSTAAAFGLAALPAHALSKASAEKLVSSLVSDVMTTINSGKGRSALYRDFENIFAKYADVDVIAQKALGPTWRSANAAQRTAYVAAFRGYMARTYGKRFDEFVGAKIDITGSRKVSGGYLVSTAVNLRGQAPFQTDWHIVDARGRDKMYNLFIEGVSVLTDVRTQIGAMLDKRGGSIDKLTAHLKTAG